MLDISSLGPAKSQLAGKAAAGADATAANAGRKLQQGDKDEPALREAFDTFVGETFYGQMLSSMRKTVGKQAYFYGSHAEEVFRGQLDQQIAQEMSKASAGRFSGPMFDLYNLNRK